MTQDPKALRKAFGRFLTGVTVVTARDAGGQPVGFTANSFTSVSLDPPMLLVCPGNHLSTFDVFCAAPEFGISILAEGQEEVSNLFATSGTDRFSACAHDAPTGGVPLISERAAGFVCETAQVIEAGDHAILLGRVVHFDDRGRAGLGYGPDGYFSRTKERSAEAPSAMRTRVSILLEHGDTLCLDRDRGLPTVDVPPGESPLKCLKSWLDRSDLNARVGVVYAVYDEGRDMRRVVFRGTVQDRPDGFVPVPIAELSALNVQDNALRSLLRRFSDEHRDQSFGFYLGNEHTGDVLPVSGRS